VTENECRVLIVDDEESVRDLLKMMLSAESGFLVVGEAEDGVEALSVALQHRPDFVILDYAMPRMNGEESARVLRGILSDVTIIAFSAYVTEQPEWADAHLTKDQFGEMVPLMKKLAGARTGGS